MTLLVLAVLVYFVIRGLKRVWAGVKEHPEAFVQGASMARRAFGAMSGR